MTIHLETTIDAPIERVFDLARDIDLHQRSMAHTGERAVAGRTSGLIELGESVTWRARHLGREWELSSRITSLERPTRFVDEQVTGPFATFRHSHSFERGADRTMMIDDWSHTAPFGPIGALADRLFLAATLRRLLEERAVSIKAEAERR